MRGDIRPVRRRSPSARLRPATSFGRKTTVERPQDGWARARAHLHRPPQPAAIDLAGRLPRLQIRPRTVALTAAVLLAVVAIGLRAQGNVSEARGEVSASVGVAQQSFQAAQERLSAGDISGAGREFGNAEEALHQANQALAANGLVGGVASGQASGDIRTAQQLLATAESTAQTGRELVGEVGQLGQDAGSEDQGFYRAGELLSDRLPRLNNRLSDLDRKLGQLRYLGQRASRSDNPDLHQAGGQFAALLPKADRALGQVRETLNTLPKLLGQDEFARYLLLFQNHAELRATGGFTGTYGQLTLDDGAVKDLTIGSIYGPSNQAEAKVKDPGPPQIARASGGELKSDFPFRMVDANWYPDFPQTAATYQKFYEKSDGPTTDGVIALTATPVIEILRVVGPVQVPQTAEPLNADNFMRTVFDFQQGEAIAGHDPKTLLRDFMPQLLEAVRKAPPEQQQRIRQIIFNSLKAKDVQVYFVDDQLERGAERAGLAGRLLTGPGSLAIVDSNLGANKSSVDVTTAVHRSITVAADGTVTTLLTDTRRHSGATITDPNANYTRLYLPKGTTVEEMGGWSEFAPPNVDTESGHTVISGWTDLEAGAERTVSIEYRLPDKVDLRHGELPVNFWRQAGTTVQLVTDVTLPDGYVWDGVPGATVTGDTIHFDEPVTSDIVRQLRFEKL